MFGGDAGTGGWPGSPPRQWPQSPPWQQQRPQQQQQWQQQQQLRVQHHPPQMQHGFPGGAPPLPPPFAPALNAADDVPVAWAPPGSNAAVGGAGARAG